MSKLLVSPYSARLYNGQPSPKNYPYWPQLVHLLKYEGYEVVQIGIKGEERIEGVDQLIVGWPFDKLVDLARDCATWLAVDNFWSHFAHYHRLQSGVVLFGASDPKIFGYSSNINLLRGRDYLRPLQYQTWTEYALNPNAFVRAENVIPHVVKLAPPPLKEKKAYVGIY